METKMSPIFTTALKRRKRNNVSVISLNSSSKTHILSKTTVIISHFFICVPCVCLSFTEHFINFKCPLTVLRRLEFYVLPVMFDKPTDVLVVHSDTILMCHLISNHTGASEGRKEERAKIGWYGRYGGRMKIGEGEEREEG